MSLFFVVVFFHKKAVLYHLLLYVILCAAIIKRLFVYLSSGGCIITGRTTAAAGDCNTRNWSQRTATVVGRSTFVMAHDVLDVSIDGRCGSRVGGGHQSCDGAATVHSVA